jgi:hypothetical protein
MKRVRSLTGIAPAVAGLMIPGAATIAATHAPAKPPKTGKSVSVRRHDGGVSPAYSCAGSTHRYVTSGGIYLSFWSAPEGSQTCIGTIRVHTPGIIGVPVSVWIENHSSKAPFCLAKGSTSSKSNYAYFGCHKDFLRNFRVWAKFELRTSTGAVYSDNLDYYVHGT